MGSLREVAGMGIVVMAGLMGVAGCASGHGGNRAVSATTVTTLAPPTNSASANTAAPSTTTTTVALPTSAELQAALLTQSDLGSPYQAQSSDNSSDRTTASGCPGLAREINSAGSPPPGFVSQEADFSAGQTGPFLAEVLLTEPPNQLAADYGQSVNDLKSCQNLSISSSGTRLDFALTPINFAAGATAARLDATLQGVQVNGYMAVQQINRAALVFIYFRLGSGSSQDAYATYQQAINKAQSKLAG